MLRHRIAEIPREEFLRNYFDYQPGEHVLFSEPTQQGKTHLAYQMLDVTMARWPQLRTVSLMPKSRDPATHLWAERLDMRIGDKWPPPKYYLNGVPRGHIFWPKHLTGASVAENRANLARQFGNCLHDQYQAGDSITLADDIYLTAVLLGLNQECEEFWTAGSGGNAGLWATMQKPSGTVGGGSVSSFAYNSPSHLILGHDPVETNRKRFSEIGGVDPALVSEIVFNLRKHRIGNKNISEKLYIAKAGPYMCIVGV